MATYPIKVLLDRNRQPFIPFATTSSIVENGTNRRLDKMLGNLDDLQTNNKNSLVSAINEILVGSGSGAGINIQIVDELPTENISLTTIYFKHMATGKLHNVYEEWMYINDAWELIGTTEMDLSGYATTTMVGDLNTLKTTDKGCIVDAVNELVDKQLVAGKGIAIDGNVISTSGESCGVYNINTTESLNNKSIYFETNVLNKITEVVNKNLDKTFILFINSTSNYDKLRFELYFKTPTTNSNNIAKTVYGYSFYSGSEKDTKKEFTLNYDNHADGSILITQFKSTTNPLYELTERDVLTKTNTTSYTPTDDYHPATKKYVDDTVAAAGTGSGSAFDPAKYLAIDNTTEYTPTDLYHPATKAYVDSQIASIPEPVDAYSKTEIDGKLSNYLSKTNTESYTPTSDYHPATKKFVESVVASIDTSGFITNSNISEHLTNYITETTLNERLMKVPYIMTSSVTITSDFDSSGHWGDHTLMCNVNNTDWSAAIQKIAHAILSKEYPKVYMPVTIMLDPDDFNKANATYRAHHLIELKPSNLGYIAEKTSPHVYSEGDLTDTYITGTVDLGVYGTLYIMFSITYKYSNNAWSYYSTVSTPTAYIYIGRVTPVTSLNLTFDNKQIIHSYTEGNKHKRTFSSNVAGCKNLPVNATTKIADIAGTSRLPDTLSTRCELFGTTVSGDVTTYTPLGEATVFVSNNEMYMKVPDITTTDYTDVVCTISMIYED